MFFLAKLHISICCEMTSFSMMSFHDDLNEVAKCVDIVPLTLLALDLRLCKEFGYI